MVTQHARQVAWMFAERAEPVRVLIRDHDRKFTAGFDGVFEPNTSESFGRRFTYPGRMGSQSGSFARFDRKARTGS
jgi:hypothetical protein